MFDGPGYAKNLSTINISLPSQVSGCEQKLIELHRRLDTNELVNLHFRKHAGHDRLGVPNFAEVYR